MTVNKFKKEIIRRLDERGIEVNCIKVKGYKENIVIGMVNNRGKALEARSFECFCLLYTYLEWLRLRGENKDKQH